MKAEAAGFAAQTKAAIDARSALSDLDVLVNRMEAIRAQLLALGLNKKDELGTRAMSLDVKLEAMEDPLYNRDAPRDSKAFLHSLSRVQDRLLRVNGQISSGYGEAPPQLTMDELAELSAEVKKRASEFDHFLATDAAAFNKFAAEQGVQALALGKTAAK
jgi:hypothetical protein